MGNPAPLVLDISSDEETVFGDARKGGGLEFGDKDDGDWLSKLLVEVGGNIDDDSDDVVFLSELFPKTPKKSRSESVKLSAKVALDDEGDDDCVVLDGDPDNPVVVVNNKASDDDDSDDLKIVGEKGEIACRDFPHPRHLCAKYLFASTPHEVHCGQCHCYVCDSLAPCLHWGTGVSSIDHCHASDKEEYWKGERKHVKKGDKPVSATRSTITNRIDSFFQSIQVPGCAPSQPNSFPQNPGLKPAIRPCVLPSNVALPNVMNRVRSQPPGYVAPRYNPQSQLASVQSHPRTPIAVAPRVSPGIKNHYVGIQNPLPPHRAVFKRVGGSINNRHPYRSQSSRDPPLNRHPAPQATVTNGSHGSNQHAFGSQAAGLSSRHTMVARRGNYLPSQPQINSQPYSCSPNPALILHQSQMPSQPSVNGSSLGSLPLQPYTYPQPSLGNINSSAAPKPYTAFAPDNHVPSQTVDSWQSDAGTTFPDQLHSISTVSSCSSAGNDFENDSAQLQQQSNPTSSLTCGQNEVQHLFHTNGIGSSPADFGFFCDSSVNHGNTQIHAEQSQYPSGAPAEISHVQNVQHDQPSITPSTLDNPPQQSAGLAAYTSPTNDADCQFPESRDPSLFDFHFLDSWMSENQSFTGAVEAAASSTNWNIYSPETAFADTGTLFDI